MGIKSISLRVEDNKQKIEAIEFYEQLGFKVLMDSENDTTLMLYNDIDFEIRLQSDEQKLVFYADGPMPSKIDPIGNIVKFVEQTFKVDDIAKSVKPLNPALEEISTTTTTPKSMIVRRLGILTSGGDSCGMNPTVRSITRVALQKGCIPFAIYEGYQGLCDGGDKIKELKWSDVRSFLSKGGTEIGTARCKEFRDRPGRLKACYNMVKNGIDALVVIGGQLFL